MIESLQAKTVLAVDDEECVVQVISIALKTEGYKVLTAEHGPAALRVWSSHSAEIDLLVTDILMPDGISGFDLAKRCQTDKPGLKIIFSSGSHFETLNPEGHILVAGRNFLPKPYPLAELLRMVKQQLA